jgi:hypothetical protein
MARRAALQDLIVAALVELFGADDEASRFACQTLVAAISAMVTGPVVAGDAEAVRALGPDLVDHVRRLRAAGLLGRRAGGG